MKKIILLCILSLSVISNYAADSGKSIVVTKGSMFTLDLASDIGVTLDYMRSTYITNQSYKLSPVELSSALSIVPHEHVYSSTFGGYYYTYDVTAQQTGNFVFTETYTLTLNGTVSFNTYTYNITVVDVTNIVLPSSVSVPMGESYIFSPVITDNRATTTLTWLSSNPAVATVDNDGKLTTTGLGTTTITCMASNGVIAQCEVTVTPVIVTSIILNKTSVEMIVGETLGLSATIVPENSTNKNITWSSNNEAVAIVDENGQVTAIGSGTCQIKATANDGSGKTASCIVTVEKNNKLTVAEMSICKGGRGTMHVLLTDEEIVSGFQFDLAVPEGITVVSEDGGDLLATLTSRATNHSISASKISDGVYRFVVVSMTGKTITQGIGDVMTIILDAANEMSLGNYDVSIRNIRLTVKRGNEFAEIYPRDNTAKLTVTDVTPGDVNGDGKISVTDVISIISYVLEDEPTKFLLPAADLNHDNKITVTDAVIAIDIILEK